MVLIVIVGAGIAGLSAAIALRRAGHTVKIYERSALNNEIGAALSVGPNASRALLAWGMDPIRSKLVTSKGFVGFNGYTLEQHNFTNTDDVARFGAPWYLAHRVDFHDELKRLAVGKEGEGVPAEIHTSSMVVAYNTETPSITLSTGEVICADLIIAANGVHSTAAETVLGRPNPAQPATRDNVSYRFLIPTADIAADPKTKSFVEVDQARVRLFVGDKKRIVCYPCRNSEIQNFAAGLTSPEISTKREDWHATVDKSKLLDLLSDFHPDILAVIQKATDVKQWALLNRAPIPTWTKNKMLLIGDAAHPMLPHQAQGAAQAIEDSVALGVSLIDATPEDLPERLAIYEKIRKTRASVIQILSTAGQEQSELVRSEVTKYLPIEKVPKTPAEYSRYTAGYDIIRDSVQHMKEFNPSFELPTSFFQNQPGVGIHP